MLRYLGSEDTETLATTKCFLKGVESIYVALELFVHLKSNLIITMLCLKEDVRTLLSNDIILSSSHLNSTSAYQRCT